MKVSNRKYKEYKREDYNIRNDAVFKIVFGSNERVHLLKSFLEAILEKKIEHITVRNEVTLDRLFADDKECKLDLLVEVDKKEKINIELQNKNEYNVIERGLQYGSSIYTSLKRGEKYTESYKTVVIWLLGYNVFASGLYHETGHLTRDSNKEILTEKMEYHYIQLPRFWKELKEIKTEKEQWLAYMSCQLNSEELEELMKMNKDIDETEKIIQRVMADEDLREEIRRRQFAEYDKWDRENYARKQGEAEGLEKGERNGKIETAKKMLSKNMTIEDIIEITELTKEEVENLKRDILDN